jgi:hypothetical protein
MKLKLHHLIVYICFFSFLQIGCSKVDPLKEGHHNDSKVIHTDNHDSEHNSATSKEEVNEAIHSEHADRNKPVAHRDPADSGVEAKTSFRWLQNGNKRFVTESLRKDGQSKKDRIRLVSGQKPHAIVLSCSDSRVPPEVLFDQKLGEIFVVRTAGEALDNTAIASIEYALEHLGSHLLVVMAHESCGYSPSLII